MQKKKEGSGLHLIYICDACVSKHMINQVFSDLLKMSGYSETKEVWSERVCVT